ncbi:MAG: mitochondrial fission ELM1 family protein [Pseudomonadota bacterium]
MTDGRAGIENQALGLAEAMARQVPLDIVTKRVRLQTPINKLPSALVPSFWARASKSGDLLEPPFPSLWIGCGRQSVPLSIAMNRQQRQIFVVQLQNPGTALHRFDMVIPPIHDEISGANVFPILGSPNRICAEVIERAAEQLQEAYQLPSSIEANQCELVGVLIGGPNRIYAYKDETIKKISELIDHLQSKNRFLVVTTSRRTPLQLSAVLRGKENKRTIVFDQNASQLKKNPYPGILALADHVLVTEDSVNMVGEAATAGAKTHIISLPRRADIRTKFDIFLDQMVEREHVKRFSGDFVNWTPPSFDETSRAAIEVCKRWNEYRQRNM